MCLKCHSIYLICILIYVFLMFVLTRFYLTNYALLNFDRVWNNYTRLAQDQSVLVETPLGKVKGFIKETFSGKSYYNFDGVPYAEPPVGPLRFEAPKEVQSWYPNTWTANTIYKCLQHYHNVHRNDTVIGEEDCLYVNIRTTSLDKNARLPVIFYIHGGAFIWGYAGMFNHEYLYTQTDVVFVAVNYRLGPLGFLSTEDQIVPGNMGLKDQIMALQWVQKYISHFGGDPNDVTIAGNSAGGASVHFQYLFPDSKDLFVRGISQSGSVLNNWVLVENSLEKAQRVSDLIGCPTGSKEAMVKCLKSKPARQIVETVKTFQPFLYNPYSPFGVVVDSWASKPLLPQHPIELLKNGNVLDKPWIISHTSHEGIYPAGDFYFDHHLNNINKNWNILAPHIFDFNYTVPSSKRDEVSAKIRQNYFGDKEISKSTYNELVKAVGDRLFSSDIEKSVRLQSLATSSPVYLYYFTHRGTHSISELFAFTNENLGASHGDDMCYIISSSFVNMRENEEDDQMSNTLVNIWKTYITKGKPQTKVNWPPVNSQGSDKLVYLHISGPESLRIETTEELGQRKFWNSLPLNENGKVVVSKDEL